MYIFKTELLANLEHQLKNHELLFYCWPAEFTVSVSIAIRIEEKPSTHILMCIYGQMFHVWFCVMAAKIRFTEATNKSIE